MRDGVFGVAVFGEQLNHARGGFGAEERAFRTAHNFHALQTFGGEILQMQFRRLDR